MPDAKVLSSKTVFQSKYFHVDRVKIERDGKSFEKDIIEATSAVWIIPYTENGEIYLASEYRDTFGKTILDCFGGKLEPGDDPLIAAKRELEEEAGLKGETWHHAATWEAAAIMKKKMYVFFVTGLEKTGRQHLDEDEEIETVKFTIAEALGKIDNGEVPVGLDVAAILLFDKFKREGKL